MVEKKVVRCILSLISLYRPILILIKSPRKLLGMLSVTGIRVHERFVPVSPFFWEQWVAEGIKLELFLGSAKHHSWQNWDMNLIFSENLLPPFGNIPRKIGIIWSRIGSGSVMRVVSAPHKFTIEKPVFSGSAKSYSRKNCRTGLKFSGNLLIPSGSYSKKFGMIWIRIGSGPQWGRCCHPPNPLLKYPLFRVRLNTTAIKVVRPGWKSQKTCSFYQWVSPKNLG